MSGDNSFIYDLILNNFVKIKLYSQRRQMIKWADENNEKLTFILNKKAKN